MDWYLITYITYIHVFWFKKNKGFRYLPLCSPSFPGNLCFLLCFHTLATRRRELSASWGPMAGPESLREASLIRLVNARALVLVLDPFIPTVLLNNFYWPKHTWTFWSLVSKSVSHLGDSSTVSNLVENTKHPQHQCLWMDPSSPGPYVQRLCFDLFEILTSYSNCQE